MIKAGHKATAVERGKRVTIFRGSSQGADRICQQFGYGGWKRTGKIFFYFLLLLLEIHADIMGKLSWEASLGENLEILLLDFWIGS